MWFLAQVNLEQAQEAIKQAANQPIEWWMAALTLGSLTCVYMVVRKMLGAQRESNLALLNMVKEKDEQLKQLNEKLIDILEDRWKTR